MTHMLIRVTAKDIAQGCKGNGGNCPIARAILRRLRWPFNVFVGSNLAFTAPGRDPIRDPLFVVEHTKETQSFVGNFDSHSYANYIKAVPFNFLLPVEPRWQFMFKRD